MKTIVGMFGAMDEAQDAVQALERAGIPRSDISLLADNRNRQHDQYAVSAASAAEGKTEMVASDAAAGAIVGGAAGLVMALTGIVIPGFGTLVAAGWFVSTLAGAALGAAAGGVVGLLTGAGVPLEDAVYYKEGLHLGRILVMVRADEDQTYRIAAILDQQGAMGMPEVRMKDEG